MLAKKIEAVPMVIASVEKERLPEPKANINNYSVIFEKTSLEARRRVQGVRGAAPVKTAKQMLN